MIIHRYISRQLFFTTTLSTVVMTCAVWLTQSLRFMEFIVSKGLSFGGFLELIAYLIPDLTVTITPLAFFMSVLFVYNKMTNDLELIVLKTSGFSHFSLAAPVLKVGGLLTVFLYCMTLYILPLSFQKFRALEFSIRNQSAFSFVQEGQFNDFGKMMLYVQQKEEGEILRNILLYDQRDPLKPITFMAERGMTLAGDKGTKLVMLKGNRQEIVEQEASILFFDQYTVELTEEKTPGGRLRKPYEYHIYELFYPADKNLSDMQIKRLASEGHGRILSPLLALVFGLGSVLIFLIGPYNRRGRGGQIAIVSLGALLIQGAMILLLNLLKIAPLSFYCAYFMIGFTFLLSLHLLRRSS